MDSRTAFFWILAFLGCIISFGKFNPVYHCIYNLPGLHFLRIPARFLYVTMFCVSILSAAGFQMLFENAPEKRRMMNRLVVLVALSLAGAIGGSVLLYQSRSMFFKAAEAYVKRSMIGQAYKMQNAGYYQDRIHRMFTDIMSALSPLSMEFIASIVLALAAIAVIVFWPRRPRAARYAKIALCLLAGTNFLFLWHGPLRVHTVNDLKAPPLARFCAEQPGLFRLYTVNSQEDIQAGLWRLDRLDPDYNVLFNVATTGVYSALGSRRYFDLLGPLGNVNLAFGTPPCFFAGSRTRHADSGLAQCPICAERQGIGHFRLKRENFGPLFLYRNEKALDRVFVAASAKVVPVASAMLDSMRTASFDPSETVLLENAPAENINNGKRSSVQISQYQDQLIKLNATGPGWLVITNLWYPGWRAWVDGGETKIYRGDYVFQAIPLPAGDHAIQLRFSSSSFKHGLELTILSLAAVLLLLAIRAKPRPKP